MSEREEKWGCVLLAGGAGTRFGGLEKARLCLEGEAFESRIGRELEGLGRPCFLSDARRIPGPFRPGWQTISKEPRDGEGALIGPLGGLLACLRQSARAGLEGLFFVPCDMPLFRRALAERLMRNRQPEDQALIWRTRDGRLQPLCAFYRADCAPVMEEMAASGVYQVSRLPAQLRCRIIDTGAEHVPDSWFANINSPQAYRELLCTREEHRPPVLAVSGRKNTGKTTLLTALIRELSARSVKTAVIKHDGHEFQADVPGTDSWRLKQAGALGTLVYSSGRFCLVKDTPAPDPEEFFSFFPEADLILLEGQKHSSWPKLEVVRAGISSGLVCRPETLLACVTTDLTPLKARCFHRIPADIPVCSSGDLTPLLELVSALL